MELALVFGIAFTATIVYYVRRHMRLAKMRGWNFDWYRREFPQLVSAGRVTCYKCGGSSIGIERLMQQSYMRGHVCRQCGTTLYYSPED